MKVSVSIPDEDVAFLDEYAAARSASRSAAVHRAISLLREQELADQYSAAWEEWSQSGEEAVWSPADADGILS